MASAPLALSSPEPSETRGTRHISRALRWVAASTNRSDFADRLLEGVQAMLTPRRCLLVLLDRRTRRPTVFGGDPALRRSLGRRLRARPRGPEVLRVGDAELGPVDGHRLLAPLEMSGLEEGLVLVERPSAFREVEEVRLRALLDGAAAVLDRLNLHQQLDEAYGELRNAHESLDRSERIRALGQMAAGVVHDVNNAMSPITAYSSLLLASEEITGGARRMLEVIHEAGLDVSGIIGRLREFYGGRAAPILHPVEVPVLLRQVVEFTLPARREAALEELGEIPLGVVAEDRLPLLFGDATALRELLMNLVLNSVHALDAGGSIELRARAAERPVPTGGMEPQITIEVVDDGRGMDAETLRRCLDPFFTTKGEKGSGLGLVQAQRIVREHGGRLAIHSRAGEGTTVELVFPGVRPPAVRHHEPPPAPPERTSLRVLCIDDDETQLEIFRHLLAAQGHHAVTATGGIAGVDAVVHARAEERPFDVVITDLGMPDLHGRAVVDALRELDPELPVVVATGWDPELRPQVCPPGAFRVLRKPLNPELLDETLRAATEDR